MSGAPVSGAPLSESLITFANVSRFYGEVLGINKFSLKIGRAHV